MEDEPDAGLGPVLKTVGTARCGNRALRLPPNTKGEPVNKITTMDGDTVEWTTTGSGTEFTIVVEGVTLKLSMLHANRLATTINDAVSKAIKSV